VVYRRGKRKTWWYRFMVAGRIIHESAKTTSKKDARKAEKARRKELADHPPAPASAILFKDAASGWLESRQGLVAHNTLRIGRMRLKKLLPEFEKAKLGEITAQDISAYQHRRLEGGAQPRTINMDVTVLRQILKANKCWKLEGDVHPLKERKGIGKALSPDEETRLLAECRKACSGHDSAVYPVAVIALNTAMRSDEIKNLRWEQVDFCKRVLVVEKSKTAAGEGRPIPLNQSALAALIEWAERFPRRQPEHYVFPACECRKVDPTRPSKSWRTAWRNAVKRAGLRIRFHDLRHTAITKLAEAGAPEQTIMAIAGHISRQMLEHYSHIRMEAKRKALNAIDCNQTCNQVAVVGGGDADKPLKGLVRLAGFEPATCCSGGNRSIHLSYRRPLRRSVRQADGAVKRCAILCGRNSAAGA